MPLALSFDKKVQFFKKMNCLLPAILATAVAFIIWDIYFTRANIWGFNHSYTLGIDFYGLPVEEWLFFVVIPYCCVFIYEVLKFYFGKLEYNRMFKWFSWFLVIALGIIAYRYRLRWYTFLTCSMAAAILAYVLVRNKFTSRLTMFYFSYFVSSIPFLIVNGILTSLPVVVYNPAHILNIRIINVPVEDFSYAFLMLLMVITIYEWLKERLL